MQFEHRRPFPDSISKSVDTLELIYVDVCGPTQVSSTGDLRCLATFTDDYTLSHVVPLKLKSAVAITVRETVLFFENHIGKRVQTVQTDRGKESVISELTGYFRTRGTVYDTAPDTVTFVTVTALLL